MAVTGEEQNGHDDIRRLYLLIPFLDEDGDDQVDEDLPNCPPTEGGTFFEDQPGGCNGCDREGGAPGEALATLILLAVALPRMRC